MASPRTALVIGLSVLIGQLQFGVKKLLSDKDQLLSDTRLVHVEFFDLRGLVIDAAPLASEAEIIRAIRGLRGLDDGLRINRQSAFLTPTRFDADSLLSAM